MRFVSFSMMNRTVFRFRKRTDSDSDYEYWMTRSPQERLKAIEILRQRYLRLFYDGSEQGLQRVYRRVKRKRR